MVILSGRTAHLLISMQYDDEYPAALAVLIYLHFSSVHQRRLRTETVDSLD